MYISHTVGPTSDARRDNYEHAERVSGWLRRAGFRTAFEKHGERAEASSAVSMIEQSKAVVVCLSQR